MTSIQNLAATNKGAGSWLLYKYEVLHARYPALIHLQAHLKTLIHKASFSPPKMMTPSNLAAWSLAALCASLARAVPTASPDDATLVRRNGCIGQGPGYCNLVLGGQPFNDRKPISSTPFIPTH